MGTGKYAGGATCDGLASHLEVVAMRIHLVQGTVKPGGEALEGALFPLPQFQAKRYNFRAPRFEKCLGKYALIKAPTSGAACFSVLPTYIYFTLHYYTVIFYSL